MRKTQTEIDVEVLKHIFTTKKLEDEITLKEKVSCGNESNRKAFETTYNALCNIGILEDGKLHQDYNQILNLSIDDVDEIINKIIETFQKFYTQNRKAFKLVNPNNYDNYKETIDMDKIRKINNFKSSLNAFEDQEENKSKKEIHKIKYDTYGKHLHSLARHTRELLFGFIHNKNPKRMKKNYKYAALNPLDAHQKHSRLAFKNVINIILKNDLKKISSSEIRDIVKNYYEEDRIKDIIEPPVGIAS